MPLVLMCGFPSSGKTRRARAFVAELARLGKDVRLVSEAEQIEALPCRTKDECFADAGREKQLRAALKAKAIGLLGPNCTVVLDGGNYIKGFRYELYCAAKACKSTQCTIFTIFNRDEAYRLNALREDGGSLEDRPYSRETFDALVQRFEEPNSQNRWDSPLFIVQQDEDLNVSDIAASLYDKKPPPPNMSTQNPPLSSTNFLYELDRVIQDISKQILDTKKINPNSEIQFAAYPSSKLKAETVEAIQPALLHKLKRQFLTFAKMQYSNHDPKQIGSLYIQYIDTSLQEG